MPTSENFMFILACQLRIVGVPRSTTGQELCRRDDNRLRRLLEGFALIFGPGDRRRARHEGAVGREVAAIVEPLRFPPVGLAVEAQLAPKALAIRHAHELEEELAWFRLPCGRARRVVLQRGLVLRRRIAHRLNTGSDRLTIAYLVKAFQSHGVAVGAATKACPQCPQNRSVGALYLPQRAQSFAAGIVAVVLGSSTSCVDSAQTNAMIHPMTLQPRNRLTAMIGKRFVFFRRTAMSVGRKYAKHRLGSPA
jgi:hypothetical protein